MPTNEEKCRVIAEKVMGWKIHPRNTAHYMRSEDPDIGYKPVAMHDWNPFYDPAAMVEVMEKMRLSGRHPSLDIDSSMSGYRCSVCEGVGKDGECEGSIAAFGPTPMQAVGEAAYEWAMSHLAS